MASLRLSLGIVAVVLWLATTRPASAGFETFTVNQTFDAGTALTDTRTVSGLDIQSITQVRVSLNISGGFNGDYYARLVYGDVDGTVFSVLLNRVGRTEALDFGYEDPSLNIILADNGVNGDIHVYQTQVGYAGLITGGATFLPDGRNIDPASVVATDSRTMPLGVFNGLNPNSKWTLYVDATTSGGDVATLNSWGLEFTGGTAAVPEPSQWAMMGSTALVGGGWLLRKRLTRGPQAPGADQPA
jgi:hypothetical protein